MHPQTQQLNPLAVALAILLRQQRLGRGGFTQPFAGSLGQGGAPGGASVTPGGGSGGGGVPAEPGGYGASTYGSGTYGS